MSAPDASRREKPERPRERARPSSAPLVPTALADETLVARARGGERWAQEALFRRYVGPMTALMTQILASEADADDVVQDALFEALSTLETLRQPEAFRGWLYRIALNRARKRLRRRRLLRVLGLDRRLEDAALSVLAYSETRPEVLAELRLLEHVLARLPADERIAWMLRHVQGEPVETIAEWLEISYATAKRRIASAQVSIDAYVAGRGP